MASDLTRLNSTLVSILIPNWNGESVLPRCMEALAAQTCQDFEVIVVDDASTDNSVAFLREHYPQVVLVQMENNQGFASATNVGATHARGEWLALLNNDAFPEPDWLAALLAATQEHPEFTLFASQLVQANRPAYLDGTGDLYHISGMAWRRYYNFPLADAPQQPDEVFSPCAAAGLYRRDAYLDVGGLDEDFTSYHEDVDLGFRLRLQGHRCLYIPEAVVHHIGSATYGHKSDAQVYFGHRNLVWSYFQNMPGYLLWWYLPAHLLVNLIFLTVYTWRGQAHAIWRAKWDALRGLPVAWQKRREIQSTRQVSSAQIAVAMVHGWWEPYRKGYRARRRSL
jgi:GT2 family glycosyltransferase